MRRRNYKRQFVVGGDLMSSVSSYTALNCMQ
jgi:hypothetical protein